MDTYDLRDLIARLLVEAGVASCVTPVGKQINVFFDNDEYEIVIRTTETTRNRVSKQTD